MWYCLCGAMCSASVWSGLMHWVTCLCPTWVVVGRHIRSGAAQWLPREPLNIQRKIPEMAKWNYHYQSCESVNIWSFIMIYHEYIICITLISVSSCSGECNVDCLFLVSCYENTDAFCYCRHWTVQWSSTRPSPPTRAVCSCPWTKMLARFLQWAMCQRWEQATNSKHLSQVLILPKLFVADNTSLFPNL